MSHDHDQPWTDHDPHGPHPSGGSRSRPGSRALGAGFATAGVVAAVGVGLVLGGSPIGSGASAADAAVGRTSGSPSSPLLDPTLIPLEHGYPDVDEAGDPVRVSAGPGPAVDLCGEDVLTGSLASRVAHVESANPEDQRGRTLMVFDTGEEAARALTWTVGAVQRCARVHDGPGRFVALGAAEGEDTVLWSVNYGIGEGADFRVMSGSNHRVVRLGETLLVDSTAGELVGGWVDDGDLGPSREQVRPVLDAVREALGIPAVDPPADPGPTSTRSPSGTGTPTPTSRPSSTPGPTTLLDPTGIALTRGYPDRDEAGDEVRVEAGPGPAVDVCGRPILTGSLAARVAHATAANPEDMRNRTLAVFATTTEARAALDWTARTVRRCADSADGSRLEVFGDTEGEDTFVWAQSYGPGDTIMASDIHRLVLVGNALLVDSAAGEAWGGAISADSATVVESREAVAPLVAEIRVAQDGA
ncbi:hypothetical protein [Phycicoccus flavus]|uniref:PknH-like extracellular domain-containing protein n=1 Tax=Phycicoccus flavus TaxID=2502783 RepID=A0A8T6R254_9MICO|nr:hypothetical protein [Phycicoccus flavus]NHA68438.1 hypothetical protein [Phycicoccus flavus]